MKKIITVLALFVMSASLVACANTLDGAGRDISKAGDKIQETF